MKPKAKLQTTIALLAAGCILAFNGLWIVNRTKKKLYAPPSSNIKYFTFGYREAVADIFWLRFLQDFGYCDQDRSALGSPYDPKTGAKRGRNRVPECSFSWGYYMLDLITELAPRFRTAALVGPLSLSVIADDIDGATKMFEKSMLRIKDDWKLYFQAGYHYLFELEEPENAILAYQRAIDLGAPRWIALLVSQLHINAGRKDTAEFILKELMTRSQDRPDILKKAQDKLKGIEK